jgi:hypothetical protein
VTTDEGDGRNRQWHRGPALEHRDIELAKASRVSNGLDVRDRGVGKGEDQPPGQLAALRVG